MKNISAHYVDGKTSTFDLKTNELVWFEDNLYYALHDIDIGDALVPDANIKKTTIEDFLTLSFVRQMLNFTGGDRSTNLKNDVLNIDGDWTVNAGDIDFNANDSGNVLISGNDIILNAEKIVAKNAMYTVNLLERGYVNVKDYGLSLIHI